MVRDLLDLSLLALLKAEEAEGEAVAATVLGLARGVAEDRPVVPVSDLAAAWAKIRRAIEFYRPDLDPEVAVVAVAVNGARSDAMSGEPTLRTALLTLLDQVDYTAGACGPTELVAAVLPTQVIALAREALRKHDAAVAAG